MANSVPMTKLISTHFIYNLQELNVLVDAINNAVNPNNTNRC